jgi:hypothetical protein
MGSDMRIFPGWQAKKLPKRHVSSLSFADISRLLVSEL